MILFSVWTRHITLAALAFGLSGCFPVGDSPADEQKDPHYLAGQNRLNSMDFDGAIAAFENALVSNPKSAAAHLELGLLYEEKKGNYATAIHHFEKHLLLRPNSNMAETIKQRIFSCKLELAKTVSFALVNADVQDKIRKLILTNSTLAAQVEQLKLQMVEQEAAFSNQLARATQAALAAVPPQPQRDPEPEPRVAPPQRSSAPARSTPPARSSPSPNPAPTARAPALPRSHIVRSGESLATISRKYNIKISALQSANPTVDARRLRVGQVLHLPATSTSR